MAKPQQLAKTHSRLVADVYQRLGWHLATEFQAAGDDEPYEYLFVWPGPGEAARLDWSEFERRGQAKPNATVDPPSKPGGPLI